jgi:hypothetical protein
LAAGADRGENLTLKFLRFMKQLRWSDV